MRQVNKRLKAALQYADRGWSVFPVNGKKPYLGTHGHRDASVDPYQIKRWWKKWPEANVGIACSSRHGPVVIDVDGPSGEELAQQLNLPPTREAASKRGRHLYYAPRLDGTPIMRQIKVKLDGKKYDLDVLGDGGYVIAPPSIHPDTNKPYRWVKKRKLARLPKSILQVIKPQERKGSAAPLPGVITEGERDELLTSLAGSMRRRGASEDAIVAALREENASRVDPPLPDKQLIKIARSISKKAPAGNGEHLTDLGNARRFIAQHADLVRNTGGRRGWRIWDGVRWVGDDLGEVDRMAKATVRSLYAEANSLDNPEEREALLKHAAKSEQVQKVRAIMELAATEPEICAPMDLFDADPWLLNTENGTIDLRTGKLKPHDPNNLITRLAPVEYDPEAQAPRWIQFLDEIMGGDQKLVNFLQRAMGYCLTGSTREQCLFFCYGRGANGKSTFLEMCREVMGDYSQQADFSTFLAKKSEGPRNDLARMRGARLVTAIEASGDRGFDETVLKQVTGSDTIVARKLYEEFVEFVPTHKLFLAANHKPIVKEHTEAFWRRIRLIPFTQIFEGPNRDKKIDRKLKKEMPGILNWLVAGALAWRAEGLGEPRVVIRATQEYREENDVLTEFFALQCKLDPDSWISSSDLYKRFSDWLLDQRGAGSKGISIGWFTRMLSERPEVSQKKRKNIRGWQGIALRGNFS